MRDSKQRTARGRSDADVIDTDAAVGSMLSARVAAAASTRSCGRAAAVASTWMIVAAVRRLPAAAAGYAEYRSQSYGDAVIRHSVAAGGFCGGRVVDTALRQAGKRDRSASRRMRVHAWVGRSHRSFSTLPEHDAVLFARMAVRGPSCWLHSGLIARRARGIGTGGGLD